MPTPTLHPRTAAIACALAVAVLGGCALPLPRTGSGDAAGAPRLAGSGWYWIGTVTPAGLVAPSDPGRYGVEFLDGGQLAAQLDCNAGTAAWKQSGTTLTIGRLEASRKPCPGAAEADRFGRQLALVRAAAVSNGLLELSLGDAGTMWMARDPDWRMRSFDCPNGAPLLVAFGRDQALVRWGGEIRRLRQQPAASGIRYAADGTLLFSKGNEASLVDGGRQVAGPCVARR